MKNNNVQKQIKKILFILSFLHLNFYCLFSQNVGISSMQMFNISPGAKLSSLGGSGCAKFGEQESLWLNPANSVGVKEKSFAITYSEMFAGIKYNYISFRYPYKNFYGIDIMYLYSEPISKTDILGNVYGEYNFSSILLSITTSKKIKNVSTGFNLKFAQESVEKFSSTAIGVLDIGFNYNFLNKECFFIGICFQNIFGLSFNTTVSPVLRTGISYVRKNVGYGSLNVLNDFVYPLDGYITNIFSVEYEFRNTIFFRCGYNYKFNSKIDYKLKGLNFGFGVQLKKCELNFCYIPYGDLGDVYKITFVLQI
jgi:hypothetical protein